MSDIKKAFEALDRLKSILKNPENNGKYGFYTDSMSVLKEDIRSIENVMPKPGTMRKKIRHAQAFYVNEYGESRLDMPYEEQEKTETLLRHIQHVLISSVSKNITPKQAIEKIRKGMETYYSNEKFDTTGLPESVKEIINAFPRFDSIPMFTTHNGRKVNYTIRDGSDCGEKYIVSFPGYPGVIGQDDDLDVALEEGLKALDVLQEYLKEKK